MRLLIKGCKRCGGSLIRQRVDAETETVTCIQCGAERDITVGNAWPASFNRTIRRAEAVMAGAGTQSQMEGEAA